MKKTNKSKLIIIAILLITLFCFVLFIKAYNGGFMLDKTDNTKNEYTSINDLINNSGIDLTIPEFILNRTDLEIRDQFGQIIEIGCSDFVFKVANFIDINADVLGLYNKSEIDERYNVIDNSNNIIYFRYRQGYVDYPNCTLVNWCTEKTSYGLMLSGKYTLDEAIELVGITKDSLLSTDEIETEITIETEEYIINDKYIVELPKFNSYVSVNELDGFTSIYLDKTLCIVFVYNDLDIDLGTFDSQKCIQIDNELYLYYREDNPFNNETVAYNDYNNFLSTINSILDSIKYQN